MQNQFETTQNQTSVDAFAQTISDPWWGLVGAEGSAAAAYAKEVVDTTYNSVLTEIRQLESKALTDTQKYESLAKLWGDLSAGLKTDVIGLRNQLGDTQRAWANKAISSLDRAIAAGDLIKNTPGMLTKDVVSALSNQMGGMVAAAQLISELGKDAANGGPSYNEVGKAAFGIGVGIVAGLLIPMTAPGIAIALGVGLIADYLWNKYANDVFGDRINAPFWDTFFDFWIGDKANSDFNAARAWFAKPDPLILDLNGNGIETIAPNAATPILFDLNGDGIKTGTGWVAATDGFLVLDRNGNGTIDNGTELFGDSTQLAAGGKAADGFAALAGQDSNLDGAVNALDANFANLQVWQDLNQDGVSQAGELKTLTELGIASLNLAKTANSQTLTGGNQIADLGSFVRADGTTAVMADVNLASDAFHRSFTDVIASTTQTAALPDMQGAGMVRDLRQAASLQSVEGAVLASALGQYAASTTRNDQRARLDTLLADWAATSSFQSGIEKTAAQNELLLYLVPGLTRNDVIDNGLLLDMSVASGAAADTGSATSSIQLGILNPQIDLAHIAALKEKQQRITKLIGILEKFNGTTFVNIDATGVRTGANQLLTNVAITNSGSSSSSSSTSSTLISPYKAEFVLALSDAQISLIEQAYASLRQSVYDGLLTQTRLKPYLDDISLTLGSNGVALDFTALNARFAAAHAANANAAVGDLLDLRRIMGKTLETSGWDGMALISDWTTGDLADAAVVAILNEYGYLVGTAGNDTLSGLYGNTNTLIGLAGNDILNGGTLADTLMGGAGDDVLNGMAAGYYSNSDTTGNIFEGGTGNDILNGTAGSDSYRYNLGDGSDTINEGSQGGNITSIDKIVLGAGITAADVVLSRPNSTNDLVISFATAGDQIKIPGWYNNNDTRIEQLVFADGTIWDKAKLTADGLVMVGTAGNDMLSGLYGNTNTLIGLAGNDILNGGMLADTLMGGAGDDVLNGIAAGYYSYSDTTGNIFEGGTGNDILNGTAGSDSYRYNLGDGSDTINEGNQAGNTTSIDKIVLGAGITAADVVLSRPNNTNDLVISFATAGDQIKIPGWYNNNDTRIEQLVFADGTIWDKAKLTADGLVTVGTAGNDMLSGLYGNTNTLIGLAGNDILNGGMLADTLMGGAGDDVLNGIAAGYYSYSDTTGNIFEGGTGNDILNGTAGSDSYRYNLGDGSDTINEGSQAGNTTSIDKIVLGAGITAADVVLSRPNNTNDLVISFATAGDQIKIPGWYNNNDTRIEQLVFADGTIWDKAKLTADGLVTVGTAGNDMLSGLYGNTNTLIGLAGNDILNGGTLADTLMGGAGDDVLNGMAAGYYSNSDTTGNIFEGGTGNDILNGTAGSDSYRYNLGDGSDTINEGSQGGNITSIDKIVLGAGITAADVVLSRPNSTNDLVISFATAGDQIKIPGWYNNNDTRIEQLVFADGTIWDKAKLTADGLVTVGTAGNDMLSGLYGNTNTLIGLAGNDILNGGTLADTLMGGAGDDVLNGMAAGYYSNSDTTGNIFEGGTGNDILNGTAGSDSYRYNLGDGSDTINEGSQGGNITSIDKIVLGAGITAADVVLSRPNSTNDLVISFATAGDQIKIPGWYNNNDTRIEQLVFADGTIWDKAKLTADGLVTVGTAGNDMLSGLYGNTNTLIGLAGNDILNGGTLADTLMGGAGDDVLNGMAAGYYSNSDTTGNIFEGGTGNDILNGTAGSDSYRYNLGDGSDTINEGSQGGNITSIDKIVLGAGITAADVVLSRPNSTNDLVISFATAGDQIKIPGWYNNNDTRIEQLVFADGTIWDKAKLTADGLVMVGTAGNDMLSGLYGNTNTLIGLAGNDILNGGNMNDLLEGGAGNDTLSDTAGANLLDGGAGTDTLTGNSGNEFFAGGTGNDTLTTGNGADIIAFNRGDGMDVVNGGIGTDNTLSLGGGINYTDLALSKVNNDLVIEVGSGEQITLSNWYNTSANYKSVLDLQVMADAMAGFDATSADPLLNQAVQNFDFTAIANAFDQARGTSATFMHWSATTSLLAAHLAGSDTAALGGDLAHQYGTNGSFTGMNLTAAQDVLNVPQFGAQAQTLRPLQGLQGGGVTL